LARCAAERGSRETSQNTTTGTTSDAQPDDSSPRNGTAMGLQRLVPAFHHVLAPPQTVLARSQLVRLSGYSSRETETSRKLKRLVTASRFQVLKRTFTKLESITAGQRQPKRNWIKPCPIPMEPASLELLRQLPPLFYFCAIKTRTVGTPLKTHLGSC